MRRRAWVLAAVTWLYIAWSLLPVLVAVQFSFNDGRSRSSWQGFSTRWYWGTSGSVAEDLSLRLALSNTVVLALFTRLVATPLGVALALGLARWRGRTSRAANGLMLLPLATPEIVMGSALFLVFTYLYTLIPLGRSAQLLGHVTFSVSYVVVIVRARLASVGDEYETAARDLGASPVQALRTILLPVLTPRSWPAPSSSSPPPWTTSSSAPSSPPKPPRSPSRSASTARSATPPPRRSTRSRPCCCSAPRSPWCWPGVLRRRRATGVGSSDALREMASIDT